jgi:putative peptidoglycan lipid II flippase
MSTREERGRDVVRQSGLTSIAAALAIASGLLLDIVVVKRFGATGQTDAFVQAALIPLGLVAIAMVGANQALVPTVTTWLIREGTDETWRLCSVLLCAALVGGAVLAGLAALIAWPLMRVISLGFSTEQVDLAASLTRVMFLIVPLVAVAEVLRALLNATYSFFAPAFMNVIMNVVAAAIVVGWGSSLSVVAWAYVAGAAAQAAFMLIIAVKRGFRPRATVAVRDARVRAAGRLLVRPLAGAGLNPLARVGERALVSFLPAGALTLLAYGYRLISAIGGSVLFRSVMVAVLPRLTEEDRRGDSGSFRATTQLGVRIMLAISIPLTALMAVLSVPATIALFNRGNLSRDDASLLGLALAVYALSIVGSAWQRALLAPFFAKMNTRIPLRNTVYGVVANLAFVPLLVLPFGRDSADGIIGVAAAYSLAQYVNVAHAWYRMRHDLRLRLDPMRAFVGRLIAGTAAMTAVLVAGYALADLGAPHGRWLLLALTSLVAIAALATLGLTLKVIGGGEFTDLTRSFGRGRPRPAAGAGPERGPQRPATTGSDASHSRSGPAAATSPPSPGPDPTSASR